MHVDYGLGVVLLVERLQIFNVFKNIIVDRRVKAALEMARHQAVNRSHILVHHAVKVALAGNEGVHNHVQFDLVKKIKDLRRIAGYSRENHIGIPVAFFYGEVFPDLLEGLVELLFVHLH